MLSFDLRSLESHAAQVDGVLAGDDAVWQEGDARPTNGVHVTGRLSSAGTGRFYFSGRFAGTAHDECRRCLTAVATPVADEVHLLFAEPGGEDSDDPDVYPIDARDYTLDLRPAVREQWLLAVPALVTCREDCKGLCPKCGADLNLGACSCAPTHDPRWDALRSQDEPAR
ncbi:MAG: hypothetical protein AMXMBFR55_00790 [Gemmatimonadota bacterium]